MLAISSGERWRDRLSELIEEADIFQLFWSSNSMRSQECRREWEHALALGRPSFIRPVYWEDPLSQDAAVGLPPAALKELHFVKFPVRPAHDDTPGTERPAPESEIGEAPRGDGQGGVRVPKPDGGAPRRAKQRSRSLRVGGIAAAAAAAALIVGLVTSTTGGGHTIQTQPAQSAASPASSPPATISGLASLSSLLPQGIEDSATQCKAQSAPYGWVMPGLVQALICNDPHLPDGRVYAFQVRTAADYRITWASFNKWWGFIASRAGSKCPPGDHPSDQGITSWHGSFFPARDGQVLECEWVGSGSTPRAPAYTWAYPTENAFFVAQGGPNTTFSALDTWWTDDSPPLASPTPAP